jgi:hypothetical protein
VLSGAGANWLPGSAGREPLLHRPWRLRYGTEWSASETAADPHDGYFAQNLAVARDALQTNPFAYSTPFLDERDDLRLWQTSDKAAGYNVIIACAIDRPSMTVELKWVELEHHS